MTAQVGALAMGAGAYDSIPFDACLEPGNGGVDSGPACLRK
jgi:hypothetical protein